jgi:hypothetical protein
MNILPPRNTFHPLAKSGQVWREKLRIAEHSPAKTEPYTGRSRRIVIF